jgi:membrane fusion protein (multidrug efflux system)
MAGERTIKPDEIGEKFMNPTDTYRDSTSDTAKNNSDGRGNLTAVETPTDLPRVNGPQSKRLSRILTAAAVVVTVIAAGIYYFAFVAPFESTDDAFIDAHVTTVAPQVAGRVERVLVKDDQLVNAGDVLLQMDARDYESKLAMPVDSINHAHQHGPGCGHTAVEHQGHRDMHARRQWT